MNDQLKKWLPFCLAGLGVLLRAKPYLQNRGLWGDEASLALTVIKTPFSRLFEPLYNDQVAPLGFSFITKAVSAVLGPGEMALRLFPFVLGILLLPLVFAVGRRMRLGTGTNLILLFFTAIHQPLVYYAGEFKPYGVDAFFTLILLWAALFVLEKRSLPRLFLYGGAGAVSLILSFPAVFTLAALSAVLIGDAVYRKNRREGILYAILFLLLMSEFLCIKALYLDRIRNTDILAVFWGKAWLPAGFSAASLKRLITLPVNLMAHPGGFFFRGLALLAFVSGLYSFWKSDRRLFLILSAPLMAALGGFFVRAYPLYGRLALYLVPPALVLISAGAVEIFSALKGRAAFFACVFAALLFLDPGSLAARRFFTPDQPDNLRPVIEYVMKHRLPGDLIYVYSEAAATAEYYFMRYPGAGEIIYGSAARRGADRYDIDIDSLFRANPGRRVWALFTHIDRNFGYPDQREYLARMEPWADRRDSVHAFAGADGYLLVNKRLPLP